MIFLILGSALFLFAGVATAMVVIDTSDQWTRFDDLFTKYGPMYGVPWEWLKDSLRLNGAEFAHEAGTTTTVLSTGHGSLISQPQHAELEIRASWAPVSFDLLPHLQGWIELLALISGLPPKDSKVVRIG
jgi:hypothetical protein